MGYILNISINKINRSKDVLLCITEYQKNFLYQPAKSKRYNHFLIFSSSIRTLLLVQEYFNKELHSLETSISNNFIQV